MVALRNDVVPVKDWPCRHSGINHVPYAVWCRTGIQSARWPTFSSRPRKTKHSVWWIRWRSRAIKF